MKGIGEEMMVVAPVIKTRERTDSKAAEAPSTSAARDQLARSAKPQGVRKATRIGMPVPAGQGRGLLQAAHEHGEVGSIFSVLVKDHTTTLTTRYAREGVCFLGSIKLRERSKKAAKKQDPTAHLQLLVSVVGVDSVYERLRALGHRIPDLIYPPARGSAAARKATRLMASSGAMEGNMQLGFRTAKVHYVFYASKDLAGQPLQEGTVLIMETAEGVAASSVRSMAGE
jgi:hypothetical protein